MGEETNHTIENVNGETRISLGSNSLIFTPEKVFFSGDHTVTRTTAKELFDALNAHYQKDFPFLNETTQSSDSVFASQSHAG